MEETIGVIGLGNMGSIIAKRLSSKFNVIGFDIDESKRQEIETEGITVVDSLEVLTNEINRLIISLPDGLISKKVINNVVPLLSPETIIIETSTILPKDLLESEKVCDKHNIKLIDAAILGGVNHVIEGRAKLLVGGKEETVELVNEILLSMSEEIITLGKLGSGMSAKIINYAVAHNVMVLISEVTSIGLQVGIEPEKLYKLLSNETTYKRPVDHRYKERILNADYEGGMSTRNARKDSQLIMELAQELNVPLFSIQASHTVYDIAISEGLGELDYASIATLWEKWADFSFKEEKKTDNRVEQRI